MSIFDTLISIIAPFECIGCGREDDLLCEECVTGLERTPSRCYRCRKLTDSFRTCIACRKISKLCCLQPVTVYKGVAKDMIAHLKFRGAQAAAVEIASLVSVDDLSSEVVIVPVPTATSRARRRGYDQAKLIARAFARRNNLPYLDCLARSGQSHQVGARRTQRLQQLKHAYRVKTGFSVHNLHIVLIDDVLTTGATLEAAAVCLKAAGAQRIHGRVFVQA